MPTSTDFGNLRRRTSGGGPAADRRRTGGGPAAILTLSREVGRVTPCAPQPGHKTSKGPDESVPTARTECRALPTMSGRRSCDRTSPIRFPGFRSLREHLDTATGTQPSACSTVEIAPSCSVNAAFLSAGLVCLVAVSRCTRSLRIGPSQFDAEPAVPCGCSSAGWAGVSCKFTTARHPTLLW